MRVRLIVTPHPLTCEGQTNSEVALQAGDTLAAVLARHVDRLDADMWVAAIGGHEVPREMWAHTRLREGVVVECRRVAKKKFLAFAIPIVLSIYAPGWGAALFGKATLGARIFAAVVTAVGSAIANKLLAPKQPKGLRDMQASPTYSLSGGRNRARPYEPLPLLFGELRYTPDYASLPYTMFEGDDQYLYSVFHAGINCGEVSAYRIGKTPIESFSGVTVRAAGISGMADETLQAWGNVDSAPGAGRLVGDGGFVSRLSSAGARALQIDVEGSLYAINDKGVYYDYSMTIVAEYRDVTGVDWNPFPVLTFSRQTSRPFRFTLSVDVPDGQYEVRVRKYGYDSEQNRDVSIADWTQLRTVQADTGSYGGMGRLGVRIKASGQINGALDEFSWYAKAKPMPYWDGAAWVTATSENGGLSNPGAQMLLYMRGIYDDDDRLIAGMGLDDAMIDVEALKGFMVWCADKGFRFDHVFDSPVSHDEVLDTIAAAGFGAHTWGGGPLGVTWVADDAPIGGVVNMATMRTRSFSVAYQTMETADGIEYAYFDRDRDYSWQTVRVAAPGVTTPLNPARITGTGVTTEAHAAIMARFHLGQSLYQRKDIGFDTDLEYLTYRRNSVLALTHDVTQWGYGGRLHAAQDVAGVVTLTLDDVVPAGSGNRYIGLRIPGEAAYRVFGVQAFAGESRTVTLSEPWPSGVPFPGASGNPAHDTIWIYDFKATPGQKVRVVSIQPSPGLQGASVACVPETDEFWGYVWGGGYTPPATSTLLQAGLPVITRVVITEELQRLGNGYSVELTATITVTGGYRYAEVWGATGAGALSLLGTTRTTRFSWRGGLDDVWSIEVRPFGSFDRPGGVFSTAHTVAGLSVAPDAPSGVAATPEWLIFAPSSAVDLAGYVVRYNAGDNAEWSVGTALHAVSSDLSSGLIPGSPWVMPVRLYGLNTIMVCAVDTSGNISGVAYDTYDFGAPDAANVAESVDFAALGWPGEVEGGAISGSDLVADGDPTIDIYSGADIYSRDGIDDFYGGSQYVAMSYIASYAPLYGGGTVLIDVSVTGARTSVEWRYDGGTSGDIYDGTDIYSGLSIYGDAQSWRPWLGALPNIDPNIGLQFRITTDAGGQEGRITAFSARTELPTIEQVFSDVLIDAGGTFLAPADGSPVREWIQIEDVQITPRADGSGAVSGRVKSSPDPDLGPEIELLNSSAVAVTGRAFVRVSGYGPMRT